MRALSTVLLLLAAAPAWGQAPPSARPASNADWFVSAAGGTTRASSMSDKATGGTWRLQSAPAYRVTIERGDYNRTFGVSLGQAAVPMTVEIPTCLGCSAQVTSLSALGFMRLSAPLFRSPLDYFSELQLGVVRWTGLEGRDGDTLASTPASTDLAYGIVLGVSLPIRDRAGLFAAYDLLNVNHPSKSGAGSLAGPAATGRSSLRFGLRVRVSR